MSSNNNPLNWFLLITMSLIWGSSFILINRGLVAYSPLQVGCIRMAVAFITMLPFLIFFRPDWKNLPYIPIILVGVLGSGIPSILFPAAEVHINHSLAGILNSLTPLFTLVVGWLLFSLKFGPYKIAGVVIGLAGAVMLTLLDDNTGLGKESIYGLYVVLATLCYATSVNLVKEKLQDIPSPIINTLALFAIAVPATIVLFTTDFVDVIQTKEGQTSFGYIFILGFIGTGLANYLFFILVQRTTALFSSMVTYTITVVSVLWGFLDNEAITWVHITGMLVILWGVWISGKDRRRQLRAARDQAL